MSLDDILLKKWRESGEPRFTNWLSNNPHIIGCNIKLSKYEIEKCAKFAEDRIAGSVKLYKKRNGCSTDKIRTDIMTGTMGELGIYHFLKGLGYDISKPDFAIYGTKKKSFAADMIIDDFNIHCKTQHWDSAKKYGISWILQCSERYGMDKLFKHRTEKDYIATALRNEDDTITILGVMSIPFLFDNDLIGEPKLKWFQGVKKALYLEELPKKELFNFL